MTRPEAENLITVINNWCSQFYDGRMQRLPEWEYGIKFFDLLPKFKKDFPENCFYTGVVYRKMEKGSICPKGLVACSKQNYANKDIGTFTIQHPHYYVSTCKNGFDLLDIVNYLSAKFELKIPNIRSMLGFLEPLTERIEKEQEVICLMDGKNFRRCRGGGKNE